MLGQILLTQAGGPTLTLVHNTLYTVEWDVVLIDTLSVWDPLQPTKIIIPAAATQIRIIAHATGTKPTDVLATPGIFRMAIKQNGADPTLPFMGVQGSIVPDGAPFTIGNGAQIATSSNRIPCTPGDFWTVQFLQTTGQNLDNVSGRYHCFGMEFF